MIDTSISHNMRTSAVFPDPFGPVTSSGSPGDTSKERPEARQTPICVLVQMISHYMI